MRQAAMVHKAGERWSLCLSACLDEDDDKQESNETTVHDRDDDKPDIV